MVALFMLTTLLDLSRLFVGVSILSYASYTDLKTRRASDILWVIMLSSGIIILIVQYLTVGLQQIFYIFFIPVMIIFIYLLFKVRLIFGGADAKALISLAVLAPYEPRILFFPLWHSLMPFPWVIFCNSVILFLFLPFTLLIYNSLKGNVVFPYSLLGYKMDIQRAKRSFVWPLEKIGKGERRFYLFPKEFDVEKELDALEKEGVKNIWVTPKIPFMIPLLAGYLLSFFLGDILSCLIYSIT
jgi:preflagellin peptidase FlaK